MKKVASHLAVLSGYLVLALLYSWPLPAHFATHYIGSPGGDTGLIVWHIWHFGHSLSAPHSNPFWTDLLYWPFGSNLLLTNFTLFNDAVAYFAAPLVGLPAAWNGLFIGSIVLSGCGVFLLLRDWGFDGAPAFVAGALFALSPALTYQLESGRGLDYSCFISIPFFLWAFSRAVRGGRLIQAALAALALTWVWVSHYYYFVACALLIPLAFACLERPARFSLEPREGFRLPKRLLEAGAAAAFLLVARALLRGQREFHGSGSASELVRYVAPYLAFWACVGLRLAAGWRLRAALDREAFRAKRLFPYLATSGLWAAMNLPMIVTVLYMMASGDYGTAPRSWRGGGNPVDALWLVLPTLYHPLWGSGLQELLKRLPFGEPNIVSLGWLAPAALVWLWPRRPRERWTSFWIAGFAFFLVLTLGPWLKLFGLHTYLPLPFYFLHLLPVYDNMPNGTYFLVFAALFMALLFAVFLREVMARLPEGRARWVPLVALALLAFESAPGPRRMFKLEFPPIVERFAERPDGAFLPVPLGANFHLVMVYGALGKEWLELTSQMVHRKPRVGGFLARVSNRVALTMTADPFVMALFSAQEGKPPPSVLTDGRRAARWLRDNQVSYVFTETALTPEPLAAAMATWPLRLIDQEGTMRLYAVTLTR